MYRKLTVMLAFAAIAFTALHAQTEARIAQPSQVAKPLVPLVYETPASTNAPTAEDWTTLSLAKSGLPMTATGGVLLSKSENPDCTRELLRLQWRPGDPIDLYVIRPRGIEKPPVILYLYNYTADTDIFRQEGWCRQARETGAAVAGFVSALSGQRFHSPRPMKQWFVSELQEALSTSTHDVQMILNYLDTRGDLDLNRVGMFGEGSGASVAVLAAASDHRIVALDIINPWGDWPDWLRDSPRIPEEERAAYLKPDFLQNVSLLDPANYLPKLKMKALRIEQVMDDPITPLAAKNKIAGATPKPGEVARYQDRMAQEKAWSDSGLSGWLGERLRPTDSKTE